VNLLYIITDLNIGGTEKILYETAKRLNKNKYRVTIIGLKKQGYYAKKIQETDTINAQNMLETYTKIHVTDTKNAQNKHKTCLKQIQKYMKQCLAYGIPAGFFDWPTSGLGPGSRYWDHPRYYERDRDLFGLYMPVACTLARIGWEPVPYARSSEPKVYVERFGPNSDGLIWWTVMNEDTKPHKVTLQIEPSGLQIDPGVVRAVDAISGKPIPLDQADGRLLAQVDLEAGDVRVLQLGRPGQLVRWRIAQAVETLDRGMRMRRLDRQKPARAVHWRPGGSGYGREKAERGCELLFTGNGRSPASASQWATKLTAPWASIMVKRMTFIPTIPSRY